MHYYSLYCDCILAAFTLFTKSAPYVGKRIYLHKAANNTIGANGWDGFKYHAGDTIVLTAAQNPYSWVFFTGLDTLQ